MKKFEIKRFKKDGTKMTPVKIKDGVWIEPHSDEEYQKNIDLNDENKKLGIKDRFIYYPGTKIPHIHYMNAKKFDLYNQLTGGPMPWTYPDTIEINKELLAIENIYEKIIEAKANNDQKMVKFLTRPLITWKCPQFLIKRNVYAQGATISNRNDKSDFVYQNLNRFDEAIKEFEKIYLKERISTIEGISSLINLLSSKFSFRVGNEKKINKNSGIGVTTFKPENIFIDDKNRLHFKFVGKKGVKWHKIFKPKDNFENFMYEDLIELKNQNNEYLFWFEGKRIDSGNVNELFRKILKVKNEEKDYLSFHSWRHFSASKAFLKELKKIKIDKEIKKIEDKNDINKTIKKGRLINKSINKIFKKVAPVLNDTPGVVKSTYSGGKIFKDFYNKYDIEYDNKKRTWSKEAHNDEIEAEKQRREQRKLERLQKLQKQNEE